jgi:hypothetical protein
MRRPIVVPLVLLSPQGAGKKPLAGALHSASRVQSSEFRVRGQEFWQHGNQVDFEKVIYGNIGNIAVVV